MPVMAMVWKGACWHRPRGPGPVEPGLLTGDARCTPTSSWWALETPSDHGPARLGQEAKRGARWRMQSIGEEIVRYSRHHRCSLKHRPV
jgi:hypothetical protein